MSFEITDDYEIFFDLETEVATFRIEVRPQYQNGSSQDDPFYREYVGYVNFHAHAMEITHKKKHYLWTGVTLEACRDIYDPDMVRQFINGDQQYTLRTTFVRVWKDSEISETKASKAVHEDVKRIVRQALWQKLGDMDFEKELGHHLWQRHIVKMQHHVNNIQRDLSKKLVFLGELQASPNAYVKKEKK